jgi:hypothetical protein
VETVIGVRILTPYVLDLTFSDGTQGEVDLASELYGEVFEPLHDHEFFARAKLDSQLGTVFWPNGADFSPELLHRKAATGKAVRPHA